MPSASAPSSASTLHLAIVSMEGVVWTGDVRVATVPGAEGSFGVMKGHTPVLSRLREGFVHCETTDGERLSIYVSGGYVEAQPGGLTVLAYTAVRSADLDSARAEAARQQAASMLHHALGEIDHAQIQAELMAAAAHWAHELRGRSRS